EPAPSSEPASNGTPANRVIRPDGVARWMVCVTESAMKTLPAASTATLDGEMKLSPAASLPEPRALPLLAPDASLLGVLPELPTRTPSPIRHGRNCGLIQPSSHWRRP